MAFSSIFSLRRRLGWPRIASDALANQVPIAADSLGSDSSAPEPIGACSNLSEAIRAKIPHFQFDRWFLPTQYLWVTEAHPLRIWEKSRQVGATKTDAFDSVIKACYDDAKFDVWVTSRDELQARLYLEDCKEWARILNLAAIDLGLIVLDRKTNVSAHVLEFANGRRIYCLSSNPNAMAGKRGHVKIDEFALHPDQRLLYKVAKPVTQWGGTLSIISTHRGPNSLFNQLIRDVRAKGNPMGWKIFSYPIQKAVEEGLVERVNEKSGRNESREAFLERIHAECIDEDQWNQEYCCIPADESQAFLSHDMITACEDPTLHLMTTQQLIAWLKGTSLPSGSSIIPAFQHSINPFVPSGSPNNPPIHQSTNPEVYIGIDVARSKDLYVMDVGIKQNGVMRDCVRLELLNKPFRVMEEELYPLLELDAVRRCCIEDNGNASHFAERAQERFGYKVERFHSTNASKERVAFGLRNAFQELALRIPVDPKLRADLHGIKKVTTASGAIRLDGYSDDSHCDRFWAKAFREEAARPYEEPWALVG